MNENILQQLKSAKQHLKDTYNVSRIGVFGSYARGEEDGESDVDLIVEFVDVPGLREFFGTEEYLEKLLQRKIDIVREKAIRPELKDQILSEVIYI
ncbi:MAG TPA: nucleotidyltransferase family protein [Spirochaetota bacterium]|nr:nucleotidyltransferase family protein [Spirochaetota bacterium]HQO02253.1 nucleotidyltransferase family protein [Spirochaetota bacterium]HQP49037.1 nucleotidyltransferase family protein [Spirochaetota bacterium]